MVTAMGEYEKVMRERKRMCKQIGTCIKCPISFHNNQTETFCNTLMTEFPAEAERIILQWASEHPVMTNRRKFEEVFGFNIATLFEINRGNAEWLDKEYKDGDHETG